MGNIDILLMSVSLSQFCVSASWFVFLSFSCLASCIRIFAWWYHRKTREDIKNCVEERWSFNWARGFCNSWCLALFMLSPLSPLSLHALFISITSIFLLLSFPHLLFICETQGESIHMALIYRLASSPRVDMHFSGILAALLGVCTLSFKYCPLSFSSLSLLFSSQFPIKRGEQWMASLSGALDSKYFTVMPWFPILSVTPTSPSAPVIYAYSFYSPFHLNVPGCLCGFLHTAIERIISRTRNACSSAQVLVMS